MKNRKKQKGFTLIELIVVIAILAILALIAIPRLGAFRDQASIRADKASAATIGKAVEMYYAANGNPTASPAPTFDFDGSLASVAPASSPTPAQLAEAAIDDMVKDGNGNVPKPQYQPTTNTKFVAVAYEDGTAKVFYNNSSTGEQLYPEK